MKKTDLLKASTDIDHTSDKSSIQMWKGSRVISHSDPAARTHMSGMRYKWVSSGLERICNTFGHIFWCDFNGLIQNFLSFLSVYNVNNH